MQSDQLHVPALYHFIVNGNRLSPEPACRTIFISFHFCTVVAIWNYLRSIKEDWAASERFDSSSKDFERFTSHCFSLLVIQCLLSGLNEVFLHVRCIPHQNSQRCFWASVCVCVCVCVCVHPSNTGHGWLHIFIQQCRGMGGRMGLLLGYHQGRLVTYLQPVHFFDIAPRLSSNLASRFPIS